MSRQEAEALAEQMSRGNPNNQGYIVFPIGDAGMLRDWFAGQAISGILSEIGKQAAAAQSKIIGATVTPIIQFEGIARDAYKIADALMAEREKTQ